MSIKRLLMSLDLGDMIGEERPVTGGLLHKMYKVKTDKGDYAVKQLNSEIMKRDGVMSNYDLSEAFSLFANMHGIPLVHAIHINGDYMFQYDNEYYMIFPWLDGKSGVGLKIDLNMCEKVARVLSDIHHLSFKHVDEDIQGIMIDWLHYSNKMKDLKETWVETLKSNLNALSKIEEKVTTSLKGLKANTISHRDLDSKNIMWKNEQPVVIDWEASGPVNRDLEFLEALMHWSDKASDKNKFDVFFRTYSKSHHIDYDKLIKILPVTLLGKFSWLDYNIKRALGEETIDVKDQLLGCKEVISTIEDILCSNDKLSDIIDMINNQK